MRLDKFLSTAKVFSRSQCKQALKAGQIKVNGVVARRADIKISENEDVIEVSGTIVKFSKFIYLMMNKPSGVLSATNDKNQKTIIDLLNSEKKFDLFPVGRLDKNTTGLVILTNDGEMAHKVLSPRNNHEKTYEFTCKFPLSTQDIEKMENGIALEDGYVCKPCRLRLITSQSGEITLTEGKYHQIKRMFECSHNKILSLNRISFSGIKLDPSLQLGEYRQLNEEEINKLLSI